MILETLELFLLSFACSIDTFLLGFAYGSNKIKISFFISNIISIVCSIILGLSFFFGSILAKIIPHNLTLIICCIILISVGLIKFIQSFNNKIKDKNFEKKHIKTLNLYEAIIISLALSIDGLAVGIGAGMVEMTYYVYFMVSFFAYIINIIFLYLGKHFGYIIANKINMNLSWLSGIILIFIAILKIII